MGENCGTEPESVINCAWRAKNKNEENINLNDKNDLIFMINFIFIIGIIWNNSLRDNI